MKNFSERFGMENVKANESNEKRVYRKMICRSPPGRRRECQ